VNKPFNAFDEDIKLIEQQLNEPDNLGMTQMLSSIDNIKYQNIKLKELYL